MIIYLDESKKLGEGKIVFWWFFTQHSHSYVNKFMKRKKIKYGIKNIDLELKSTKATGKIFYEKMISDTGFNIISKNIVWINVTEYYHDNLQQYKIILWEIIEKMYPYLKNYKNNIEICADKMNFWNKVSIIENDIWEYLNTRFSLQKKMYFRFESSKSYSGIQIADLISYQLRVSNINWDWYLDDFMWWNVFNMDVYWEFKAIKKVQ